MGACAIKPRFQFSRVEGEQANLEIEEKGLAWLCNCLKPLSPCNYQSLLGAMEAKVHDPHRIPVVLNHTSNGLQRQNWAYRWVLSLSKV